ncbi:MAG: glycine cleavage system aminomethyltransferase GcvT [Bacteroidota bacterium]
MKQTAFHEVHTRLGGKMVDFAGFRMPVQYTGIMEEHRRVRQSVGVFDVSHMGEVELSGPGAAAFLQSVTINDINRLVPGKVQYSAMCEEDGGIVDDLLVYHMGDRYMMVLNAANNTKDIAWLQSRLPGDVTLTDVGEKTSLLAVQGPRAEQALQPLTAVELASISSYHFARGVLAGVPMIISRTGYTGEAGFELYFPSDPEPGRRVWDAIMDAGGPYAIGPAGLGARDTLRLEMGYCLYGNDIDRSTNPLEAGLGWITRLEKGNFVGRDALVEVRRAGLRRKLVGFTLADRAFPRHGYEVRAGGKAVGRVTSGTFSPTLETGLGMGYVPAELASAGTSLSVVVRGREIPATVCALPFVKK